MTEPRRPARYLIAVTCAIVLLFGLTATVVQIVYARDNTATLDALEQAREVDSCSRALRVRLVDGPTFRALKATAERDPEALAAAVADGRPDLYERTVALSATDPEAFFRECRRLTS